MISRFLWWWFTGEKNWSSWATFRSWMTSGIVVLIIAAFLELNEPRLLTAMFGTIMVRVVFTIFFPYRKGC